MQIARLPPGNELGHIDQEISIYLPLKIMYSRSLSEDLFFFPFFILSGGLIKIKLKLTTLPRSRVVRQSEWESIICIPGVKVLEKLQKH